MIVTVSPGRGVTSGDLKMFNDKWMTPTQREWWTTFARESFTLPLEARAWDIAENMAAMVSMFELTKDRIYLDHLREMSGLVLSYRDDRRADKPGVVEAFRGRVMPAWGQTPAGVSTGGLHFTSFVIAGIYSYPIAAFARIVAEDAGLHGDYGDDAGAFAYAALETLWGFRRDFHIRPNQTMYYRNPETLRGLTEAKCQEAYEYAAAGQGPDAGESPERKVALRRVCNGSRGTAGYPTAHNEIHALVMAMIETWRALDSPFLRERFPAGTTDAWSGLGTIFPPRSKGPIGGSRAT